MCESAATLGLDESDVWDETPAKAAVATATKCFASVGYPSILQVPIAAVPAIVKCAGLEKLSFSPTNVLQYLVYMPSELLNMIVALLI
jgi:hypothetical protein